MDHPNGHKPHGGPQQVLRDSPYHQEQPLGCCLHRDEQCSIHGGYSCKYHLVTPPSCVEEPVQPDAQDSPRVASRNAPGPQEY
jgi:hypothetical protein